MAVHVLKARFRFHPKSSHLNLYISLKTKSYNIPELLATSTNVYPSRSGDWWNGSPRDCLGPVDDPTLLSCSRPGWLCVLEA